MIGLPGETISYENDQLRVNGKIVKEPLDKNIKTDHESLPYTTDFTLEELINQKNCQRIAILF